MTPKAQVATETVSDGEIVQKRPTDRFAEYMALRAEQDERDNAGIGMDAITDQVLTAETEEEVWEADMQGGLPDGKDIAGIEQRIFGADILKSKNEEISNPRLGNTFLIVHSARLDNGQEFDWNTSAPLLVTKIIRLIQMGKAPFDCVVRGTDLGAGKTVLKLYKVSDRAI